MWEYDSRVAAAGVAVTPLDSQMAAALEQACQVGCILCCWQCCSVQPMIDISAFESCTQGLQSRTAHEFVFGSLSLLLLWER